MNTKHVPDVELCQEFDRLCKEKNITLPETEFYWSLIDEKTNHWGVEEDRGIGDQIPAPLVSEQGEWMNKQMARAETDDALMQSLGAENGFMVWLADINHEDYPTIDSWVVEFLETTEANARQKMLNYLIAEGIITNL